MVPSSRFLSCGKSIRFQRGITEPRTWTERNGTALHKIMWYVMTSQVYELDLHGQKLENIDNLEKVCSVSILFHSANDIAQYYVKSIECLA